MSRFRFLPLASALAIINMVATTPVMAKTFYVDAINGNDAWTGELADPASNNGPWQTLANLNAAMLAPGDSALLRCGQTWAETLKIRGAGSISAPIRIGSYPSTCADKPGISGFKTIPAHAWETHNGQIHKVKLPYNPIQNGSVANNITGWKRYSKDNSAVIAYEPVCPDSATGCLKITSGNVTRQANLAISPAFPLEASKGYEAKISVRIPAGARYAILVRRNGPTHETLGLSVALGGTGGWQHLRLPFNSTRGVSNARIDVEFYDIATNLYIKDASVTLAQTPSPVILTASGEQVVLAHHPNAGIDPSRPQSIYFNTTAPSTVISVNGKAVSPDIVAGSLILPAGATITPGQKVHVRTAGWQVGEHTVTGVSGTRITFEPPTAYPLYYPKWGYFFTGALWMLDSPGEWHFDTTDNTLYAWLADGSTPQNNLRYADLGTGIDLTNGKFVQVDGLRIEGVKLAVQMQDANSITLRNLDIADTLNEGIRAIGSLDSVIEFSRFARTGGDAIYAPYSHNLRIASNNILDNGVLLRNGLVANLPKTTYAAIRAGTNTNISQNRIQNAAYMGIWTEANSRIESNAVLNICTVLNDCGGVMMSSQSGGNTDIVNNIFDTGRGNTDGIYPTIPAHAAGLYFDEHAHDVRASGNTITAFSYGAQIHNSWNITLEDNTFYGNTTNELFMQEQKNAIYVDGDLHSNVIRNNRFFPLDETSPVYMLSSKTSTYDFGIFDSNHYSTRFSPIVLVENQPGNVRSTYTLLDWQTATENGVPRNQDALATITAPKPGYAIGLLGSSVVWNGDFSSGKSSWSSSSSAPAAVLAVEDCSPGPARCLGITTGGGNTSVGTPRFSIDNQWYRASFDIRADRDNTPLWVVVRRAGTISYAYLMSASAGVTAGQQWKRYSFNFKSNAKVVANEAPGVLGARMDFEQIPSGRKIWLANVEMVPLTLPSSLPLTSHLLTNTEGLPASLACPITDATSENCAHFVDFADGSAVNWPLTLGGRTSKIVFTQHLTLPDTDKDGIADSQDQCAITPSGQTTNAKGCAFGE